MENLTAEEIAGLRARLDESFKQSTSAGDAIARFALHVIGFMLDKAADEAEKKAR